MNAHTSWMSFASSSPLPASALPFTLSVQELTVDLQGLESTLQFMNVTLAALHNFWIGRLLGHHRWLWDQAKGRGIGIGPHGNGTFRESGHLSFTCSLYHVSKSWCCFFIIDSYSCLISCRTLIRSSPGVVSTFTLTLKSFGTRCSSISCLITEKENELAVMIRRLEVYWLAAVNGSFRTSASVVATLSLDGHYFHSKEVTGTFRMLCCVIITGL